MAKRNSIKVTRSLVPPIKGTKTTIKPRKVNLAKNEKRTIKGSEPPYSTYAPGEEV